LIDALLPSPQTNTKGFKVLPPYVRVIWGDGIDYESLVYICTELVKAGYSTDSIGFGSGGGLLQKLNRDTQKCAFKCSECVVDGKARFVFKVRFQKARTKIDAGLGFVELIHNHSYPCP
jgi:nicotinic acid phosphoribosyltransferase